MKKLLLAVCCLFMTSSAFAQWEIGIKISPSIGSNRIVAPKELNFESLNSKTHFGGGVIADYFFGENYAFSTGLIYNGRGAGVKYNFTNTANGTSTPVQGSDEFGIQYLEIPVTLKLFTNDIATDTRLYFQAGGSLDPRISAKVNKDKLDPADKKYTSYFNLMDISALFGLGAEKQMGESTKIFGGFSYHRGLIDIDDHYEEAFKNVEINGKRIDAKNIEIKNNYVSLDLGLKF
jgi:Outer membrane protein beta-barrel domain